MGDAYRFAVPIERKAPEDRSTRWAPRKSSRLYLDDLDEIVSVMKGLGEVQVDTPNHRGTLLEAAELSAVDESGLRRVQLSVAAAGESIEVTLGERTGVVASRRDDNALLGAVSRVQGVITRSQNTFGGLPVRDGTTLRGLAGLVLGVSVMLVYALVDLRVSTDATRSTDDFDLNPWWIAIPGVLLAVVTALLFLLVALRGPNPEPESRIVLALRADSPSWWRRHRTEVVINVATNILVGIVFFALGIAFG